MIHNLQPYEKFSIYGADKLTDEELLAIILRTGTKEKNALSVASEVLQAGNVAGNPLLGLYHLSKNQLMDIPGIGEVKATKLLCITELSKRIAMATAEKGLSFTSPATVAHYFMEELRHRETECLVLVCLDVRSHMISQNIISVGSIRSSMVPVREIFIQALEHKAANIILLHNHPSGDASPSVVDFEATKNVSSLGALLGIPLLDHIIIGDRNYFSFMESGNLQ